MAVSDSPNVRLNPDGSRWVWDGRDWNLVPAPTAPPPLAPGYAAPYVAPVAKAGNGLAIASLVLGICGAVIFPLTIPQVLAVIFAPISMSQSRRAGQPRSGLAVAGLVIGAVGILAALWFWIYFANNCVRIGDEFVCS